MSSSGAMQSSARQGLNLILAHGKTDKAREALARIAAAMREHGLAGQASAIERHYASLLNGGHRSNRQLPTECQRCFAPVRSDEVEWIDSASAECAYCGTVLKVE